eukprot:TRINITY_DN16372_c0_g1_i2.p1 TRINITY_DN16372_c0_g1~~TRINITY_DN16372_c0_g1_i2.p1  ORF type:complete len:206 (-),score=74.00 TRINITY_DN16372_c0_g1_i2:71-688(-)
MQKAMSICANNAARLEYSKYFSNIHSTVMPLYEKLIDKLASYERMMKATNYSKAKCFYALEYLDFHSRRHVLETELNDYESNISKLYKAAQTTKVRVETSSAQKELCRMLASQKVRLVEEKKVGNYYVDAFVEPKTVIEFDGRYHFFSDTDVVRGENLVKLCHLKHKGYDVINVSYKDWMTPEDRKKTIDGILLKLGLEDLYVDE